jgi:proton glutamate symport protein
MVKWSLAALVAGLTLGLIGHFTGALGFATLESLLQPLGSLFIAALRMVLLPLVVTQLLAAITSTQAGERIGLLGIRAIVLFVVMLVAAGLLTLLFAPPAIGLYEVDRAMIGSIGKTAQAPETEGVSSSQRNLLAMLLFTVIFAMAVRRLPEPRRGQLTELAQGLAEAMLTVVRWLLIVMPVGIFALTYAAALHGGGAAAGLLGVFIVLVSGLMLLFTILLYPVTSILGRMPVRTFAKGVAPAQLVAVSTQSSIASLPALIEGARDHLKLPPVQTGFVLPLTVSLFKLNRTISTMAKLLFLAHVYDVPLRATTIATFMVSVIILSFSTVGVPGGGVAFTTLPAYVAAGLPVEGIVLLEATVTIPDIFKTLLNVTGDMSAATLLSRSSRP